MLMEDKKKKQNRQGRANMITHDEKTTAVEDRQEALKQALPFLFILFPLWSSSNKLYSPYVFSLLGAIMLYFNSSLVIKKQNKKRKHLRQLFYYV